MEVQLFILVCACFVLVSCHPTVYKYNENKMLEPDLIPVSSTVISIPVYQVVSGVNVGFGSSPKNEVQKKPISPGTLLTIHGKKKAIPIDKPKPEIRNYYVERKGSERSRVS